MTPEQIVLVEETVAAVDMCDLDHDFYRRLFDLEPALAAMFTTDPGAGGPVRRRALRDRRLDPLAWTASPPGCRPSAPATAPTACGPPTTGSWARRCWRRWPRWGTAWTPEAAEAWAAYDLVAETMQQGVAHPGSEEIEQRLSSTWGPMVSRAVGDGPAPEPRRPSCTCAFNILDFPTEPSWSTATAPAWSTSPTSPPAAGAS